jgi:CBS domain-containing protein
MQAGEVARPPVRVGYNATLHDVRNALMRYNISRVVVGGKDGRTAAGIITEKDLARFLYADNSNRSLGDIGAGELVAGKRSLVMVARDAELARCARMMVDNGISSLLVTDAAGAVEGIFTKTDLLDVYSKYYGGRATVGQYMTSRVMTVEPDEPVHTALLLMADGAVSRLVVVVSEGGGGRRKRPVGIVTGRDVLAAADLFIGGTAGPGRKRSSNTPQIPSGARARLLVRDVMVPEPIMITDYSDLMDAAMVMRGNRISGLPVVDSDNNLVGIVTKTDVVRAMAALG